VTTEKVTMKELDAFYREKHSDIEFDEYLRTREINWAELPYERKLAIYRVFHQQESKQPGTTKHDDRAARAYHARPEVIEYFRINGLNHESGDYRRGPTVSAARFLKAWYWLTGRSGSVQEFLHLCRFNNLHQTRPDDDETACAKP
jgi:hypothetical protein